MSTNADDEPKVFGVQVRIENPAAEALLSALCRTHAPLWTLPEESGEAAAGTAP